MMDGKNSVTDLEELLQHTGWIRNLAAANLRDHALAEDVSQEVLVRALTEPRPSGKVLRAWLAAVTCNIARNEIRGRSRRRAREAKVARKEGSERDAEQQEMLVAIQQIATAVKALSPKHRRVIVLRFYEERSFREISKELGITENNARVRLHRSLGELRGLLESRHGDWRESCLLLVPAAAFPAPSWILPMPPKLLATISAALLVAATLWWQWPAEVEVQQSNIHVVVLAEQDEGAAVTLPAIDVHRETMVAKETAFLNRETGIGRVLHNGFPVEGAKVVLWQSGEIQKTISAADGTYELQLKPQEYGFISAYWEGMYDTVDYDQDEGTTSLLIHLKELASTHKSGGMVFDGTTDLGIPGAHVRLFADWSGGTMDVRFSRTGIEFLTEGVTDAHGKFEFPAGVPPECVVVQASAEGYIASEWWGGEAVLYPGVELPVRLVNLDGYPLANVEVAVGLVNSVVQRTDNKGFLAEIGQWGSSYRETEPFAAPQALIVRLPGGQLWRFWHGNPMDADAHGIRITVDDTPFYVELVDTPLPEGTWVEVAGGREGNLKWTDTDDEKMWQRLVSGERATLKRGWVGDINGVRARLMPGKVPLGNFSFEDRIAIIAPNLVALEVTFEGPSFDASGTLVMTVDSQGHSIDVPILNGSAKTYLPAKSSIRCSVEKWPSREKLVLDLPDGERAQYFRMKVIEGEAVRHFREVECKRERVEIRVNGQSVLGGNLSLERIEADGTVAVYFDKRGIPFLSRGQLILPGDIYEQDGGPVLTSFPGGKQTEWPGRFHRLRNGKMVWDLELASVELWVPKSARSGRRYLRVAIGRVDADVRWPNLHGWRNDLEVPSEGGWLAFRVPADRYSFSISESSNGGGMVPNSLPPIPVQYGGPIGKEFPAGVLTRVHPDGSGN